MIITRSGRWGLGAAATSAALAAALVIPAATQLGGTAAEAVTSTVLATFTTQGTFNWTVPTGTTTVTLTVFGASGGAAANGNTLVSGGGPGGEARGQFRVRGGEIFQVVVGGHGSPGVAGLSDGGFPLTGSTMGGGGGDSDVRIGGRSNACAKQKSCDFPDRIVVGGGGGGGGATGDGGAGGGAQGVTAGGAGGAQEPFLAGHAACRNPGGTGVLGCGGDSTTTTEGAGGGGWYGGNSAATDGGGGGGGSGYVSPLALSGSFPGGTRVGDGRVVITTP